MKENGDTSAAAVIERNDALPLPKRAVNLASRVLRRLGPVRWTGGKNGETKITPPEDLKDIPSTNGAMPIYSPLLWRFDEEPPGDSRYLGLFLFSANHRAGSTLLQRICNARKKTLIWGENNEVLQHFTTIYVDACQYCVIADEERETFFKQSEDPNLWTASMNPEAQYLQKAVIASARMFLNTFYSQYKKDHDLLGFKEVRYGYHAMALIRRCYPEAKNFLLIRNPIHTWRSTPQEWYPSLEAWIEKWRSTVKCFLGFSAKDPRCHLLRYEDLIAKDKKTVQMVSDTARVSLDQIDMVLANKIGSTVSAKISPEDQEHIREGCREEMELFGY